MLQAVLVDLDGTLADSVHHLKEVFFNFLQVHGVKATDEEFAFFAGYSLFEIISDLKSKYSLLHPHDHLYQQYAENVFDVYSTKVEVMPGAVECLAKCRERGLKIALVTAASEPMARLFLARHQLEAYFDVLVCARNGEAGKPHPALYQRALTTLHLTPERSIAIEDSLNGVKSAVGAGCKTLWLVPSLQPEEIDAKLLPELSHKVCQVTSWQQIQEQLQAE